MVRFIPAQDLKDKFAVFGHFYSVQFVPRKLIECRSVLEIAEAAQASAKALSDQKPDAVFIMMNPGSSRPLVEVNNRIRVEAIHEMQVSLVPTRPDTTQYQVMRLMHYCGWRYVRVLNLSDIRCAKSVKFFKQFKRLEGDHSYDAHSIFSLRRADELASRLIRHAEAPVILAWGVSPALDPLIDRCLATLPRKTKTIGLTREGTIGKYLHPLPSLQSQKVQWVNQMVKRCRGLIGA